MIQELRIGNYIQYETHDRINEQYRGKILKVDLNILDDIQIAINAVADRIYCGIPLTPEILEKAGFESTQCGHNDFGDIAIFSLKDTEFSIIQNKDGAFYFEYNDGQASIFDLHQLQNLYYCLCGEELNIQL